MKTKTIITARQVMEFANKSEHYQEYLSRTGEQFCSAYQVGMLANMLATVLNQEKGFAKAYREEILKAA